MKQTYALIEACLDRVSERAKQTKCDSMAIGHNKPVYTFVSRLCVGSNKKGSTTSERSLIHIQAKLDQQTFFFVEILGE